jgi:alkylation response protein AidB-like acyl-CoA dehydrogenase
MLRAAREALMYSEFRDVFGRKISQFPLAAHQVQDLVESAQRTIAGAFKLYDMYIKLGRKLLPGLKSDEPLEILKQRFILRELILMQKITTAYESVNVIRKAMSIFGGHGVMEEFSSLPRLLRDAMVNELWEGPRNVLLTQIYRDLQRAARWYDPAGFVADTLKGVPRAAGEWEEFCDGFFRAYQEQALEEVGKAPITAN